MTLEFADVGTCRDGGCETNEAEDAEDERNAIERGSELSEEEESEDDGSEDDESEDDESGDEGSEGEVDGDEVEEPRSEMSHGSVEDDAAAKELEMHREREKAGVKRYHALMELLATEVGYVFHIYWYSFRKYLLIKLGFSPLHPRYRAGARLHTFR